jgi:enamine deaminase RidA (YjgF/YER057c/UK114 family)
MPHPAWAAVGTTGLLAPNGAVEIQMIAYVPQKPKR